MPSSTALPRRNRLPTSGFSSAWDASGQIPQRAVEQGLIDRWGAIDDLEGGPTCRQDFHVNFHVEAAGSTTFDLQEYLFSYQFKLFSNFTFFTDDPERGHPIPTRFGALRPGDSDDATVNLNDTKARKPAITAIAATGASEFLLVKTPSQWPLVSMPTEGRSTITATLVATTMPENSSTVVASSRRVKPARAIASNASPE